jgi:hypothetical protein
MAPATTTTTVSAPRTQHLDKHAYVVRMQQLGRRLGTTIDGVYPIDTGTANSETSRATIAKLTTARVSVGDVLASLQQIVPPTAVRSDHRRIVRGVRGIAVEMQQVVVALRKGDIAASMEPASLQSLADVTGATDSMESKGYDVLGRGGTGKS